MSTKKEIEQEILNLCESEQNYNAYYPQIEEQVLAKDKLLIQVIVNVTASALDSNSKPPITNFLMLLLVQKTIQKRSQEMINEAHQSDAFLKAIEKIARHDKNNKDPNRGKTLYPHDPEVGQQLLILVLEFIAKMAKQFPADSQKKPTKFHLLFTRLSDDGVMFPKEPYVFFETKKKKKPQPSAEDQDNQQQQPSKTPGSGAGSTKTGKFNPTAIMEEIKQSVNFMMDFLSQNDDFDEDLEKELVNQTQRFTKHSKTLSEVIQQETELPEDLMSQIFQYIEFITNFCDHSQEVIGEGYLKESTLRFKNWLFSSELPFSQDDEESQSIKKRKTENDKTSSKNEKQPSEHFDFNSFPAQSAQQQQGNKLQSQQLQQQLQDGQEDAFGAFSKSAVNRPQQSSSIASQQFRSEINNINNNANTAPKANNVINSKNQRKVTDILEDEDNIDEAEQHRLQQAELDRQMRGLRQQQEEDRNNQRIAEERLKKQKEDEEKLKKQREDEEKLKKQQEDDRLRRQKEADDKIKKQQQEEEERIRQQKEAEDRQRRQKEAEDKLRKQQEDEQNALRRQRDEDERKRARIQQDAEEAEKMRQQLLREQQEHDKQLEESQRQKAQQLGNQKPQNNQNSNLSNEDSKNRFSFNGGDEPKATGYFFTPQEPRKEVQGGLAVEDNRVPSNPKNQFANSKRSKIEQAFGEAPQEKFSFGDPLKNQSANQFEQQNNPYHQNDNQSEMSFNEQFSVSNFSQIGGRNNPSQIGQNFPKLIRLVDNKVYKGEEINGNQIIDRILNSNQYDATNKRNFKKANLKRKNTIYEDDRFQIGCVSEVIFDQINQQNYIKLTIYVGNKTRLPFRNVQLEFDGDESCYVHQKIGKGIEFITAKTQEKTEIVIGHYDVPYGLVNIILSGQLGEIESNEEVNVVAFLPNLLPKYFIFMDLDAFAFKSTWKQMNQYIQKTDIFTISKSIIKSPTYFRKFFTKTLELTPLDLFLTQQNYDTKYYKLGALVELYDAESQFLLKFNIRPDNTLCIQIIAINQAYRTTATILLQHLRFLFQG